MNKVVWKYPLATLDVQTLRLPKGAEVLYAAANYPFISLWALVDPASPESEWEDRSFRVAGTGHPMGDGVFKFIGTAVLDEAEREYSRTLVFHVFEIIG